MIKKATFLLLLFFALTMSKNGNAQFIYNLDFEDGAYPPTNWTTVNPGATALLSNVDGVSGFGVGSRSLRANFYNVSSTNVRSLTSPLITTFASGDSIVLDYAYSGYTNGEKGYIPDPDSMKVQISTNGGTSFIDLGAYSLPDIATADPTGDPYVPTAGEWGKLRFAVPGSAVGVNCMVRFYFRSAFGNLLYMDNIKIGHPDTAPDISISGVSPQGATYYVQGTTSVVTSVTVTNLGLGSSPSITVNRKINPGGYSTNSNVSPLAGGASATLNFSAFSFTPGVTYTIHDTIIATGETNFANNSSTTTFTPLIAKHILLLRIDQPSVDSMYAQMSALGITGDVDTVSSLPVSFSPWKTVIAPFPSGTGWSPAFRSTSKAFLDGSTLSDKKTFMIFGNDLGYAYDPVQTPGAAAADTLFYRQYMKSRYISDSWIADVPAANSEIKGLVSPFNAITSDSVADPYPDMIRGVNGGSAAFVPMSEDGNGDSAAAVFYGTPGTLYNMFYGSNVYANYRTKSNGLLTPANIFGVLMQFVNNNGGVLPVELASFNSTINSRNVTLNWTTTTEQNNSSFVIERKLTSTADWSSVGNVQGAGNSNSVRNYTFADNNVATGKYNYRLKQIDFNGNFKYYDLSNEVIIGVPTKYDLSQNYPNPFNPSTKINYDLPFDSKVAITLFDIAGREVANIVNTVQTAGSYTVTFNASTMASGVYFYQISATGGSQNFVKTMKMLLVK